MGNIKQVKKLKYEFRVGADENYATKEAIPASLRYVGMSIDDVDGGVVWELIGGILDASYKSVPNPVVVSGHIGDDAKHLTSGQKDALNANSSLSADNGVASIKDIGISYAYDYIASSGQTEFYALYSDNNAVNVHQNGVLLLQEVDYVANDGVSVVFVTAVAEGDVIQIRGADGNVALVGAQNMVGVALFTNLTGLWINSPDTPITEPIEFSLTSALNGGVAALYYKATNFEILDPDDKLGIVNNSSFVSNEVVLVWMVYDAGADKVHLNIQIFNRDNEGVGYDLPFNLMG